MQCLLYWTIPHGVLVKVKNKIKTNSFLVEVTAPGSPVLSSKLKKSLSFLKKLGFQPRLRGPLESSRGSLFAQDGKLAFNNFKKALFSKDSRIIWCLRGGYGSQRLLSFLDQMKVKPKTMKLFIGSSDATVLHDWIHQNLSWPTVHFSLIADLENLSRSSLKSFRSLIFDFEKKQVFSGLKILNFKNTFLNKKILSRITGGNLTMIRSQIGTSWNVSRKNQIVFLEDNANEKPYAVDRSLRQLWDSGVFKGISALIFGQWLLPKKSMAVLSKEVLEPFSKKCEFPVLLNLPCGHGRVNHPLPLAEKAELTLRKSNSFLEVKNPMMECEW